MEILVSFDHCWGTADDKWLNYWTEVKLGFVSILITCLIKCSLSANTAQGHDHPQDVCLNLKLIHESNLWFLWAFLCWLGLHMKYQRLLSFASLLLYPLIPGWAKLVTLLRTVLLLTQAIKCTVRILADEPFMHRLALFFIYENSDAINLIGNKTHNLIRSRSHYIEQSVLTTAWGVEVAFTYPSD